MTQTQLCDRPRGTPRPQGPRGPRGPKTPRRPGRRLAVLGATGTLVTGVLAAAVPAATADIGGGAGAGVAAGVRYAAEHAAREGVHWAACPSGWNLPAPVECGAVRVPVDYAHPRGATIELALDRVRGTGTPAERRGALVYNPGGPGSSGMRFPLRVTTGSALWKQAARVYDFVGFDPRGVGHSAPVSCESPREYVKAPKPDPVPVDEAGKQLWRGRAARYAESCAQHGGALLPQLTTPNLARDLDVIRAALGERRLNYLGVSYGTYLGAVYATLFPGHVGRMVVDSVVNPAPDQIWYRDNLDQDVAFQRRWEDWETWVARHDAVYHLGRTAAQVEQRWQTLRATARRSPIGGTVGPAELVNFFQNAPYYDVYWPAVAGAWSRYAAGDARQLIAAAGPNYKNAAANTAAENENAVYTAVECNDAPWPRDWRTWDRDNTALNARYPFMTWPNAWMNLPCATWSGHRPTPVDVRSRPGLPPVLIVAGTRDAATPYQGAVELHRRLGGSRLITERDAGSHGVTTLVNPCINDRVTAFLVSGRLDDHDVVCGPHAAPRPTMMKPSTAQRAVE